MRGQSGALRAWAGAVAVVAGLQTPACASPWVAEQGRLRERETGLSLEDPVAGHAGWQRVDVEGARLAYRGPDGAVMSFLRDCQERRYGAPRDEARHLLLGLEARELREDRAVEVAGAHGWLQSVAAREEGRDAWLRTVTRLAPPCREDWVLATPGPPGDAAEVFDAWWRSYRPPPAEGSAASGGAR